ncbi:MAG: hypothetical protein HQK58_15115 [Deltaproteobacteria bacterium]|nr:hypothetical protein [Deltaproteobacteria bacterium]
MSRSYDDPSFAKVDDIRMPVGTAGVTISSAVSTLTELGRWPVLSPGKVVGAHLYVTVGGTAGSATGTVELRKVAAGNSLSSASPTFGSCAFASGVGVANQSVVDCAVSETDFSKGDFVVLTQTTGRPGVTLTAHPYLKWQERFTA